MRVNTNEKGYVIGQDHPRAKLTDDHVDLIRELHEESGYSYNKLAWIFSRLTKSKVSKLYIRDICTYRRRCQIPMGTREVEK